MKKRICYILLILCMVMLLPCVVLAAEYDLNEGDVTITASKSGQIVTQGSTSQTDNNPTITQKDNSITTDNTITIKTEDNATANVTIEDVNIKVDKPGIEVGGSNLNLTVKGDNKIENTSRETAGTAGIHLAGDGNLTITGDGKLHVKAVNWSSAAIGTNRDEGLTTGSITIAGNAQVSCTSGDGAGIGTGVYGKMDGSITIEDNATVIVSSLKGAGIGSGKQANMSGSITIDDTAKVTASSSDRSPGAGIGTGGGYTSTSPGGEMSGTISISNKATVDASIGAGNNGTMSGTIQYFDPEPEPVDEDANIFIPNYYVIKATAGEGGSISPSTRAAVLYGGAKTFTITPNDGYTIADVKVDGTSVGAVKTYTLQNIAKDHKIEATFTKILEETEPVEEVEPTVEPAWDNPFSDVSETDTFYEAVKFAYENGYMNGMSENTFAPNEGLTRAMLVTVLYRAAGSPVMDEANPFTDVADDAWYYNAVVWAKSIGLVTGITETEFVPENELTREQLVTIFYRYATFLGYDLSIGEDTNILSYEDFADIAEYAIPAMQWACGMNLIENADGNILPKDNATRALVAMVLYGFYA